MIRFGIVGAGAIANKFCEAAKLVPNCSLVAVASRSLERANVFADTWDILRRYGSYEQMFDCEILDVVYIATTNNTHKEICLLALGHKMNVLCEKPLVLNLEDINNIIDLAKENRCFLMEAMWSRFLPCIVRCKDWIQTGRIGEVHIANMMVALDVSSCHRIKDKNLGGGILYDLGVYALELLPFLLDKKIVGVQSIVKMSEKGIDKADGILLDFGSCIASVHCSMNVDMGAPSFICGEKGYISIHVGHKAKLVELFNLQGTLIDSFSDPYLNGFEHQIKHVCHCMNEGFLESPIMPLADTLACVELFEQIL